MAGLLDLFSGRSSDIYGQGLLTPEQRGGLGNIGLLALAGKLGQLAGPSFSPVPDFGAALGQAAGAYGASQEGAGTAALNAILTGQKGRKLEQELDYYKQLGPILGKLAGQWPGAGGGAGGGEGSGSTGGGAAAPAGAGGGGGGGGGGSDPRGMIPHITAEATRLGIDPTVALQVARSEGLGIFSGDHGKSGGAFQLYTGGGMGNDFIRDTGLDPLDPKNEKATITYALEQAAQKGWGAWNGAKRLGITGFTGIGKPGAVPTAAAPAEGGGLLNLPDPSGIGARAGFGLPAAAAVAPGASPEETANRIVKGWTAGSGSSAAAPPDIYAGTDTPQGPMGDPGPAGPTAMASGLLTPGGPLSRGGVPGLPAMPPAAAPSADPSLQLGPLAAPAPAAAAPAAPGPGLLSPPGASAAALPRGANPAYDAWLRNAGVASALAKMSGLPGLDSLISALKDSPGYAAELERARQRVGVEFAGPKTTAEKTAAEPFAVAASERELKNALIKEGWQLDEKGNAVPIPLYNDVAAAKANAISVAQEGPKLDSALAQQNKQRVYDANGKFLAIMPIPGGVEADTAAAAAKARVEAGERSKFETEKVTVFGPDGRNEETTMSKYEIAQRRQQVAERVAKGVVAPQPGDIVGTPVFSDFEKGIQAGGTKWFETQRAAADTAAKNIQWNNESIKLLDSGLYAGWGAPVALQFARVFNIGGTSEAEKIQNTQKFLLERGQQVAAQVKAQPGSASDKDVEFANRLSLGDITLDEGTIRQMLELYNKYNRQTVDQYNDAAGRIRPDVIGGLPLKVPVDAPLKPMDPESRQNAQAAIARGAKPGPIRNKIRAQGFDPEGL